MNKVYILKDELNSWISKCFNKDLISIDDLISCIEDLDEEIDELREQLEDKENDYPNEERDREIEILGDC
jgi:bacterioferritin (cytochrome b1)